MPNISYSSSISGAGVSIQSAVSRNPNNASGYDPTLPAGYPGTLTTRTDGNTGTVTLESGHAITTAANVDIHWASGVQYDVTVGTVAGNSMPFDAGVGDDLPAQSTLVVVTPRVIIEGEFDGDELSVLGIQASQNSFIAFYDGDDNVVTTLKLPANQGQVYDIEGGASNAFSGEVIEYMIGSNGTTTAGTLKLIVGQEA